ncbi:uncharacterized protein LOC495361 [Xenopus laevis]|uniref:LOC495361 protein n=1 Tax=Xenopus laevis TaxID=8355 RepID=Q5U559_XENLA|nr:uncharacterized protein LOC495361 [Xenopus laevis]AAH84825.1 LOC495361 protein [Xenopus laevis]
MRQQAKTLWYDRAKYVFLEFCVENSRDVKVDIKKDKVIFSCLNEDNIQIYNEIQLYDKVQPLDSREKRSDRSITCFLRKCKEKVAWPRITKENTKPAWLFVDFDNWRDWDAEEEGEMALAEHYLNLVNGCKDKVAPPSMDDLDDLDDDL